MVPSVSGLMPTDGGTVPGVALTQSQCAILFDTPVVILTRSFVLPAAMLSVFELQRQKVFGLISQNEGLCQMVES